MADSPVRRGPPGMTLFPVERLISVVAWRNYLTGEHALTTWSGHTTCLWTAERPGLGTDHRLTEVWKPDDPGAAPPPGVFILSAFVRPDFL